VRAGMVLVGDTSLMVAERDAPASLGAPLAALALVLAAVWMILYTPAALIVAALWKSVIRTLNPVIGLDTIRRMGLIYGQVLGLYAALSAVQWLAGFALGFVPYVGSLGRAVVDAYVALAVGAMFGLVVYKKGAELNRTS